MAINKYFRSGETYNADDLNRIVAFLRTDGVYGEIADSLKVVAVSGTTVNVFSGIGWREGCMIELTTTEPYTLPTTNGTYSICIKLTKNGDAVTDISIGHEEGQTTENYVLAWVTVSGGVITNVDTTVKSNSTFNGASQILTGTAPWEPGEHILLSRDGSSSFNMPEYTASIGYRMGNSGVIRIKFDLRKSASGSSAPYYRIYKNDVPAGTERTTSSENFVTFSEDISVSIGDIISFYYKGDGIRRNTRFCISRGSDVIQQL